MDALMSFLAIVALAAVAVVVAYHLIERLYRVWLGGSR